MIARHQTDRVLACFNYGWEVEAFYRDRMPWDPEAPRQVVQGSLDPMNPQSEHSEELLELFQRQVLDEPYRLRLQRHYQLFRDELRRRTPGASPESAAANEIRDRSRPSKPAAQRIPAAHQERFAEVAALIEQFGQAHLDAELTGFVIELWSRICRRKAPDCLRGKPSMEKADFDCYGAHFGLGLFVPMK